MVGPCLTAPPSAEKLYSARSRRAALEAGLRVGRLQETAGRPALSDDEAVLALARRETERWRLRQTLGAAAGQGTEGAGLTAEQLLAERRAKAHRFMQRLREDLQRMQRPAAPGQVDIV